MRRRVLDFACWLFGHRIEVREDYSLTMRCECGKHEMTLRAWLAWR